jgi:hypothetical protein
LRDRPARPYAGISRHFSSIVGHREYLSQLHGPVQPLNALNLTDITVGRIKESRGGELGAKALNLYGPHLSQIRFSREGLIAIAESRDGGVALKCLAAEWPVLDAAGFSQAQLQTIAKSRHGAIKIELTSHYQLELITKEVTPLEQVYAAIFGAASAQTFEKWLQNKTSDAIPEVSRSRRLTALQAIPKQAMPLGRYSDGILYGKIKSMASKMPDMFALYDPAPSFARLNLPATAKDDIIQGNGGQLGVLGLAMHGEHLRDRGFNVSALLGIAKQRGGGTTLAELATHSPSLCSMGLKVETIQWLSMHNDCAPKIAELAKQRCDKANAAISVELLVKPQIFFATSVGAFAGWIESKTELTDAQTASSSGPAPRGGSAQARAS